ncbi:uroporphyrinogen decarboxylase [Paenibacillus marinisediminis]
MTFNDRFLRACRKEPVDRLPVWYMRQAGRYDPDYRKIKEKYSLLEICRQPELAAEVTMMPVHKLGVDAAILYSDIMNPVASIGIDFDIVANIGPVIQDPIRSKEQIERLKPVDPEGDLGHILETIRILDRELKVPLITFAGAPFTIASYLIEGRPSKSYIRTKTMMYETPELWFMLMDKLGDMVITYVRSQIKNGGKAFQLFDSWAGSLSPRDFQTYVLPTIERIYASLSDLNVPNIYFPGVSSGELLPLLHQVKASVIGLDWRVSIEEGRRRLGDPFAVQGNMDPYLLTGPMDNIQREARYIMDQGMLKPGYIFNLGHGLFPEASLDKLKELTEYVHNYSADVLAARRWEA